MTPSILSVPLMFYFLNERPTTPSFAITPSRPPVTITDTYPAQFKVLSRYTADEFSKIIVFSFGSLEGMISPKSHVCLDRSNMQNC
jgi:hypothetical protein